LGGLVFLEFGAKIFRVGTAASAVLAGSKEFPMSMQRLNHISGWVLVALSLIALVTVFSGYFQSPQADEGAGAHIFQLCVGAFLLVMLVFLATADWKQRRAGVRPLIVSGTALGFAFAALYYLEHYFYLQH
jgi:hypothetical protein